jgi:hypothetical protein
MQMRERMAKQSGGLFRSERFKATARGAAERRMRSRRKIISGAPQEALKNQGFFSFLQFVNCWILSKTRWLYYLI